jgi:tetratricopeptide (TPR) repeat protein
MLNAVINNFVDEKELQERARVYLAICERQATREPKPRSFEDRLNAVTITLNRGAFDEGLAQLRKLENEDSSSDYVQYLLSVAYASVGNVAQALTHLRNAIDLLPENRFRAAQDPDLEPLRQDPAFAEMAEVVPRRRKIAPSKKR